MQSLNCLSKRFVNFQGDTVNFTLTYNSVLFPLEPFIQFAWVSFKTKKKKRLLPFSYSIVFHRF